MKSEWADYAVVQGECGNLSENELTHNSSGTTQSQSSQLAEPLWTYPSLKSGISLWELISTLKKKVQAENEPWGLRCAQMLVHAIAHKGVWTL